MISIDYYDSAIDLLYRHVNIYLYNIKSRVFGNRYLFSWRELTRCLLTNYMHVLPVGRKRQNKYVSRFFLFTGLHIENMQTSHKYHKKTL